MILDIHFEEVLFLYNDCMVGYEDLTAAHPPPLPLPRKEQSIGLCTFWTTYSGTEGLIKAYK